MDYRSGLRLKTARALGILISAALASGWVASAENTFGCSAGPAVVMLGAGYVTIYPNAQINRQGGRTTGAIPLNSSGAIEFPIALPLAGTAIMTALLFCVRRRSDEPGHCSACGYDLKGSVSGICPECGLRAQPGQAVTKKG